MIYFPKLLTEHSLKTMNYDFIFFSAALFQVKNKSLEISTIRYKPKLARNQSKTKENNTGMRYDFISKIDISH